MSVATRTRSRRAASGTRGNRDSRAMGRSTVGARVLGVLLALAASSAVVGQRSASYSPPPVRAEGVPKELERVDIDATKLGASVPLDVEFIDESGRTVTLRQLLQPGRPAILQLGYLRCPMLCNLVLNKLVSALRGVDWSAGEQFDVISVSINPDERFELAAAKKQGYLVEYGRARSGGGWHFLTGPAASSQALADAIGFGFARQPDGEYAHAACLFVLTPDGKVSRQLYGAEQKPATLRMALLEASGGAIGTIVDRFILWCHVYDPDRSSYSWFAFRLMQVGGVLTLTAIVGGLVALRLVERRRVRLAPPRPDEPRSPGTTA